MHATGPVLHRRHRRQTPHVRGEAKIAERDGEQTTDKTGTPDEQHVGSKSCWVCRTRLSEEAFVCGVIDHRRDGWPKYKQPADEVEDVARLD
jgi:hypothetical protein